MVPLTARQTPPPAGFQNRAPDLRGRPVPRLPNEDLEVPLTRPRGSPRSRAEVARNHREKPDTSFPGPLRATHPERPWHDRPQDPPRASASVRAGIGRGLRLWLGQTAGPLARLHVTGRPTP